MGAALRRWRALPLGDQARLAGLMLMLPMVSASLRMFGYKRTRVLSDHLSRHLQPRTASPVDLERAESLAQLAAIAGRRGPIKITCLRQALAVHLILRRRGLAPRLKLGVDRQGSQPDMHAWVELEGQALAQPALRHRAFRSS